MKIILLKKVKNLGDIGDIRKVADGYALNFLIPQKMAGLASAQNLNNLVKAKAESIKLAAKDLALAQAKATKLQGLAIEIKAKANNEGKLYSAISTSAIAGKLREKGLDVEHKQINLMKPIKELGEYSALVVFNHGLEAEITIVVTE
ncbi:MAG: 50S ribosomal protein L9 [Candidatus Buchananbacteria bacterium RIFCSPHIGHO2_02_FULL_40_13]|uniref:Large ribosomal subunit protein bL9 n=1 Tax=Candidatus Buchananbacteria bacterium RIFCSPLOWO2_01_FULL_39_33 TaxID=1797543 RepID=A0A1G1YKT8_9BACT|nr:MAG: 50S ribosomal protein L9 [Candidatus Buchananbacteria bacterium RIFCSPHIGHO2_01_FULL_40_35]OGY50885.1 MAG: 50S ribosomal protein L9 [Candidatus Buchananbacteria bacterium RIFCSPHIGHO2_02_FULL_40_13]OGY52952.1 MAG: 50S ribosomal protein L9 [Candidatus Buchananbacteria bacterium RIFCSPLOWO2_01_FULL_39_33]